MRIFRAATAMTATLLAALLMFANVASAADATGSTDSGGSTVSTQSFDEPTDSNESSDSDKSSDSSSGSDDESDSSSSSSSPTAQTQSESEATSASTGNAPTGVYGEFPNSQPLTNGSPAPSATNPPSTGTFTFPGIVNAPTGTYSADADPDYSSTGVVAFAAPEFGIWMPADTPFGSIFGASGPATSPTDPARHLNAIGFNSTGPSAGISTTISFTKAMWAGSWGFALVGDSALNAIISGVDANGNPLTGAQLGGGTFDVCASANAPLPCGVQSGSLGTTASNVPTWDATTSTCTSTAIGFGGTCWFRPTAAVRSITLRVLDPNNPNLQFALWIAALKANIAVGIGYPGGASGPPVLVDLIDPDGQYLGSQLAAGGTTFSNLLAASGYVVKARPPAGYAAVGSSERTVDLLAGDAFELFEFATPSVHPQSGEVTLSSFGTLPTTGSEPGMPVFFAVVMLAVGAVLLRTTRRRFV